ncbi:hypothetical protein K432DRAFT_385357 [Lepidopterella palustris CBS 459.81]|uniref:SnoaL-like domain-containing protein n=1 Tax=Lepidopterella palustris CBS 459.81 TaxID=1314670 RepID=A0A8E2JBJ7_9PEZI|nr:hypothetical protein K432DRAFT_385357 [Lepidopterella palustris CBS 459.81]
MPPHPINPIDYFAIQNVLSRYCIALDTKDFDLLSEVFTPNVDAKYPFPGGDMKGLEAVQSTIRGRLGRIATQHCLTTQVIAFNDSRSASATTYFTGSHFGQGEYEGQVLTAHGKYVDELICLEGQSEGMPGASGNWMVRKRTVIFMARIGDEAVMGGK